MWSRILHECPEQFKPVGETEFVVGIARETEKNKLKAQIIIGRTNMMLGTSVREVLELHEERGRAYSEEFDMLVDGMKMRG